MGFAQRSEEPPRAIVRARRSTGRRFAAGSQAPWPDEQTVVVFCAEFGRTPGLEIRNGNTAAIGRDHHPHGFTIWLAWVGIKKGVVHGATDELGFRAVVSPHFVTDLHATVHHLLGLDSQQLDVPGRKRLEIAYGKPTHAIFA